MRNVSARGVLARELATLAFAVPAQTYPARAVRVIVPNAPGGLVDSVSGKNVALMRGTVEAQLGPVELLVNNAGWFAAAADETPLGRIGEPEEVAAAVAYILSEASSFVNGQTIAVRGGRVTLP